MKILFDLNHAAHVHFVKNAYNILTNEGHECLVAASDKPLVYKLLNENEIPYLPMGSIGKSMVSKLLKLIIHDFKLLFYCIKHRPDIILGIVAIRGSHVGWLLRKRIIVFTDTEHAKLQIAFFKPFASEIHTPEWFNKNLGPKQIRYRGFHELAYLHPNNFSPRKEVLQLLGVKEDQKFFLVRFVSWDATHDINQSGIAFQGKKELVNILQKHGKVFISSEYPLEDEFKHMEFNIPSSYLHDAINFSSLVIGEGATTACEAALLGVPSIYINSISLGYIDYLESEFDLMYHILDFEKVKVKLERLLSKPQLKEEWEEKKRRFIATQIDTTAYIQDIIKNDTNS